MSDTDTSNGNAEHSHKRKKYRHAEHKRFQLAWLEKDKFKNWLQPLANNKEKCRYVV